MPAVLLLAAPALAATWNEIEGTANADISAAPTRLTSSTAWKGTTSCADGLGMIGWSAD